MWPSPQFSTDLVTFTEEIINGKLHFFVQWMTLVSNESWSFYIAATLNKPHPQVMSQGIVELMNSLNFLDKSSRFAFTVYCWRSLQPLPKSSFKKIAFFRLPLIAKRCAGDENEKLELISINSWITSSLLIFSYCFQVKTMTDIFNKYE